MPMNLLAAAFGGKPYDGVTPASNNQRWMTPSDDDILKMMTQIERETFADDEKWLNTARSVVDQQNAYAAYQKAMAAAGAVKHGDKGWQSFAQWSLGDNYKAPAAVAPKPVNPPQSVSSSTNSSGTQASTEPILRNIGEMDSQFGKTGVTSFKPVPPKTGLPSDANFGPTSIETPSVEIKDTTIAETITQEETGNLLKGILFTEDEFIKQVAEGTVTEQDWKGWYDDVAQILSPESLKMTWGLTLAALLSAGAITAAQKNAGLMASLDSTAALGATALAKNAAHNTQYIEAVSKHLKPLMHKISKFGEGLDKAYKSVKGQVASLATQNPNSLHTRYMELRTSAAETATAINKITNDITLQTQFINSTAAQKTKMIQELGRAASTLPETTNNVYTLSQQNFLNEIASLFGM